MTGALAPFRYLVIYIYDRKGRLKFAAYLYGRFMSSVTLAKNVNYNKTEFYSIGMMLQ